MAYEAALGGVAAIGALLSPTSAGIYLGLGVLAALLLLAALELRGTSVSEGRLRAPRMSRRSPPLGVWDRRDIPAAEIERVDYLSPRLGCRRLLISTATDSCVVALASRGARDRLFHALHEIAPNANFSRRRLS